MFGVLCVLVVACSGRESDEVDQSSVVQSAAAGGTGTPSCPASLGTATFPAPLADGPTGGFGAPNGSFVVGPSGEPIWRLPLELPPGPPGMTPSLGLAYRPGSGQEFMPAGWTLSGLSVIARCPKTLAHDQVIDPVQLTSSDPYCLDGHRLVPVGQSGTTTEYRTQPDTFVRVLGYNGSADGNSSFEVVTPNGTHRAYGTTAGSRINSNRIGGSGSAIPLAWLIDHESSPATSATIDYRYFSSGSATTGTTYYFPQSITYPGGTITLSVWDPSATDPRSGWQPYRFVSNKAMIKGIQIDSPGAPSHTYHLNFGQGPRTGRTLLADISEDVAGPSPASRQVARFDWNTAPANTPWFTPVDTPIPLPQDVRGASLLMMDMTGDGLPDALRLDDDLHGTAWATVSTAGGTAKFNPPQAALAGLAGSAQFPSDPGIAIDYDQDGLQDLLMYSLSDSATNQTWKLRHTVQGPNNAVQFELWDTLIPRPYSGLPPPSLKGPTASAHLADVNGDGVDDLINCAAYDNWHPSSWSVRYWVPTGSPSPGGRGFEATGHSISAPGIENEPCGVFVSVLDIDGDHRAELLFPSQAVINGFRAAVSPYLSLDLRADGSWALLDAHLPLPPQSDPDPVVLDPPNAPSHMTTWADLNGDGLPDAIQAGATSDNVDVFFNQGGFFAGSTAALANGVNLLASSLGSAVPVDLNSDGRQDLLVEVFPINGIVAWLPLLSTGSMTTPLQPSSSAPELALLPYWDGDGDFPGYYGYITPPSALVNRAVDINGDGAVDILSPGSAGNPMARAYMSNFAEEDTLRAVTNGTNARSPGDPLFLPDIAVTYKHLIDSAKTEAGGPTNESAPSLESSTYLANWDPGNTCNYPRRCVVGSRRVVASYTWNDGEDRARVGEMRYRDGRGDTEGLGWIGFGERITVDLATGTQTLETYDNLTAPTLGDYPGAGLVQSRWRWTPALPSDPDPARVDVTLEKFKHIVQVAPHAGFGSTFFVAPASARRQVFQTDYSAGNAPSMFQWILSVGNGALNALSDTTTTYDSYDSFGNVHAVTSSTFGVDLSTVRTRTYQNDTINWVLGRPLTDSVCSTSGGTTQCATNTIGYDAVGRPSTRSFSTSDTDLVGAIAAPNTAFSESIKYDAFGNPVSILKTDSFNHVALTCAAYDVKGIFLQALRDPLNHTSYFAFDSRHGQKIAEIDPNLAVTQWSYDGWGRPAQEIHVNGRNVTTNFSQASDPDHGLVVRREVKVAGGQDITTQYDSAGRPTVVWSGTLGPYCAIPCPKSRTKQYTLYDPRHLVPMQVSIPVDESVALGSVTSWSSWTRDAVGRVTSATPPWAGGKTTFSYSGNTVTAAEPISVTKSTTVDPLGRTTQITEPAGTTQYAYGPFSQVRRVVAQGSSTDEWHDAVGHTIQITTPDTGTTKTVFDGFGHPVQETDALSRVTTFSVDVAGRMLRRTDLDGVAVWTWDTAAHGIGELASVTTSPSGVAPFTSREDYTYDTAEQLATRMLTVGGETFSMSFTYAQGNVDTVTYPQTSLGTNFGIQNFYDPYGHLARVDERGKLPIWTLTASDYAGHTTGETFANGDQTTTNYYPDKNRVHSIITKNGANALQALSYTWDDRLNLGMRGDDLQTTFSKETFTYDTSDRLKCAAFTGTCALSVSYDASGNITNKSGVGVYTYTNALHPHAVTQAGSDVYKYDLVGNQIQRPDGTVSYTAANLPKVVTPTSGTASSYVYDGLEDRIQKTAGANTTTYVGGLFERVANSNGRKDYYYSIASRERVVAILTRSVVGTSFTDSMSYVHVDHLGSPDVIVITGAGGPLIERRSFDAFGKARQPDWSKTTTPASPSLLPVAYTGQENDNLGLVDMKGRMYDPRLGRMLQADPFIFDAGSLQGWNRYGYVENNPLRYTDPSGFEGEDRGGGGARGSDEDEVLVIREPDGSEGQNPPTTDPPPNGGTDMDPTGPRSVDTRDPSLITVGAGGGFSGDEVFYAVRLHVENPNGGLLAGGSLALFGGGQVAATLGAGMMAASQAIGPLGPQLASMLRSPVGLFVGAGGGGGLIGRGERAAEFVEEEAGELQGLAQEGAEFLEQELEEAGRTGAVIEEGKFGYLFGQASGNAHNVERALQNASQLSRIGVYNNAEGRALLQSHFDAVVEAFSNVIDRTSNQYGNFVTRESLFAGPGGFIKFRSTWQMLEDGAQRFCTAIPFGGPKP